MTHLAQALRAKSYPFHIPFSQFKGKEVNGHIGSWTLAMPWLELQD